MYRKIIFDLDGVITSESAFWDSAALTVAEFMGFPMDTPQKLRETLFCHDKLIRLVKNRGVNSNWDLVYLFFCFFETTPEAVYETIEKSKKLAKELIHKAKGIIELYTVYFAPYPNTKMVQEPEAFDISINKQIQDMNINTMRTPVVSTKELSRNEIYDIKHEFDEFIKREYECAAKESTKSDILQGLTREGKRLSLNPTWEKVYLSKPHIVAFLDHITEKEQKFNSNYYILRTFEDIKFDNGKLVSDVGEFEGLEKDILSFATGIYTAGELANILNVSIDEVEQSYYNLNERCLVYMSEF